MPNTKDNSRTVLYNRSKKTVGITQQKTRKEQLSPWSSVIEKLLIV
jgi:hypothetical protein